jgi:hypothetical protein
MSENKDQYPDFSGKCLSISLVDDETSHDLYDPIFEVLCGRLFLIGNSPAGATESGWVEGCRSAVAWDRVTDYFVFEDLESYIKGTQISKSFYSKPDSE